MSFQACGEHRMLLIACDAVSHNIAFPVQAAAMKKKPAAAVKKSQLPKKGKKAMLLTMCFLFWVV
jgi:hypothetical protein